MYTGEDDQTHFEDLELRFPVSNEKWKYLDLGSVLGARLHINSESNVEADFHNAPRRQLVIYLTGSRQLINGRGEGRVAEPGTIVLAEDLTGQGHRTRCLVNPQQLLLIPLESEASLGSIFGL